MDMVAGFACETVGDGEPLLLIHGSHVTDSFLPLMHEPALAERYRLIRYRRRGFTGSAPHSGPFTIEQQANDAAAVLKALDVESAHLVGHSYGGVISFQLTLQSPELVRTLIMLEPPIIPPDRRPGVGETMAPLAEVYASGDHERAVDLFWNLICDENWREEISRTVPGGPEQAFADAATFFEVEVPGLMGWNFDDDAVRRIQQPSLFVVGGEGGEFFESFALPEYARLISLMPNARQIVLPGQSHMMQMRNPTQLATTIADFIQKHTG